jgi:hypothetical protein
MLIMNEQMRRAGCARDRERETERERERNPSTT